MNKPNIVWCRIDERLIHGQGQLWIKSLKCNLALCANDESASNAFQQDLMKASMPPGVEARFFSIQKTIDVIHKAIPSQLIFMVIKNLDDLEKLIDGGVPIEEVNIGNIHDGDGKIKVTRAIYLDQKEKEIIKKLLSKGVKFNTKTSPGGFDTAKEVDIKKYLD